MVNQLSARPSSWDSEWRKVGLVVSPTQLKLPRGYTHTALPTLLRRSDGSSVLFFASRDAENRSHIFRVALEGHRPDGEPELVLGIGELGAFDDHGVTPAWIVEDGSGRVFLYYTGWNLGRTVPFYLTVGLAISADGRETFSRYAAGPILPRDEIDPFLTASPCVLREGDRWRMWYVSGQRWNAVDGDPQHFYHIRYAESADGIGWKREGRVALDFKSGESAFGRPSVLRVENGYRMWYCVRGSRYRLGLATSSDGCDWTRIDDRVGLTCSLHGWDSEEMAYPYVFSSGGATWMLYNGNNYGATGIGLAVSAGIARPVDSL